MIPHIIHQTWKIAEVPLAWRGHSLTWRKMNPSWEYRLWSDSDCRSFVRSHFPKFLATYDSFPYSIQRADAFRYLVLFKEGGVYADLDTECLAPFDSLASNSSFFAAFEPDAHARIHQSGKIIGNAIFGASAGHPFIGQVIQFLASDQNQALTHRDVLTTTGPLMFTKVYRQYLGCDLTLLPSHVLYPESDRTAALAVHHWSNGWVGNLAGELYNPDPHNIEGFTFYPAVDSPGFDLLNAGRNISAVAHSVIKDKRVIGFNTDGFLKHRIRPRMRWRRMRNVRPNEGLYVKNSLTVWRGLKLFWGAG